MKLDSITWEIEADGTIKIDTTKGGISTTNHLSADKLVDFIHELAGGEQTREKHGHSHHGEHTHEHEHEHH